MWELVPLPGGRKPIRNKWVYKIKKNGDDQVERYRARLQLDVKTVFLHGNIEEEIYTLQPEGFKQKGKENLVCRLNKSLHGFKALRRAVDKDSMKMLEYRNALIGKFNFAMICTRSDIAHAVGVVSRYMAEPGYVDSDYTGDHDEVNQPPGNVVYTSCETISRFKTAISCGNVNNRSRIFCRSTHPVKKTFKYHFIREKVEEGTVDMQKIHIDDNVSDYLTKAINGDKFIWCRSSCGLAKTDKQSLKCKGRINVIRID
ncbi:retrovirus-related pol polyprotein from transposon TNT 1-94 [Tanacetum coccineum]